MRIPTLTLRHFLLATASMAALALFSLNSSATAAERGPVNLDLEEGELGEVPTGWILPKPSVDAGFKVQLTEDRPKSGKRCALVSRDAKDEVAGIGNLMQSFEANAYQGKRVRLRAAVRTDLKGVGRQAQLWLRVDRKDDQPGFFDNMGDRPIRVQKEWGSFEIVGDVADDAVAISFGLMLNGNGRAWLDAVSFEVLGKAGEGNEPARPLRGRALDNLVAFTKLLGYVRYFHPSDEAAAMDWQRFAIDGVKSIEEAKDAAELAESLEKLFKPIAPTVSVFPTGKPPTGGADVTPAKEAPSAKFVAWYHIGMGTVVSIPGNVYSSVRVSNEDRIPVPNVKQPALPDPTKPFSADLGGGVSCSLPLALYADDKGTLPRPPAPAKAAGWSKPEGFIPSGNDRSTRLAAVALAWNVFQHFYPYFDVVKTDWPGELRTALVKAAADADERAFLDTLCRLVAGLHDGHGNVVPPFVPSAYYPSLRWDWIEDRLVVTRVAPKGAGDLKPGDVVTKINGRPAAEALADQEQLISAATPQFKRYRALSKLAGGLKDSEITLDVQAAPGEAPSIHLRRSLDADAFLDLKEPRPAKVEEIKPGIVYVDLGRITDKEFEEAVPKLAKAKGIIFDLRGYPGRVSTDPIAHLIDKPVTSAQWQVPIVLYPDRKDMAFKSSDWKVKPQAPRFEAKVAFVTDGQAISYAETYMGIIENYKLAAIVGGPTAGTNGNINPFTLPGGYRVIWTGMKVLKHDGSRHHGVGIQPTEPAARTIKGAAQGRDEVLERAIEVVSP
jgi:C-terminal processing protease CtpA/Prc